MKEWVELLERAAQLTEDEIPSFLGQERPKKDVVMLRALARALAETRHGYRIDEEEHWLVPVPRTRRYS